MIKKLLIGITVLVCVNTSLSAQEAIFGDSEKLLFLIRWGVVHGGYATLEVNGKVEFLNKLCYTIISRARSNKFFDTFYKVRDLNKSWIDVENLISHGFMKDQNEGKHNSYRMVEVYYDKSVVKVDTKEVVRERPMEHKQLQDVLSALYYIRTYDIKPNESYNIDVYTENKEWSMLIKVLKEETVKVPAGEFKCFLVKPEMKDDGIFKSKGDLFVWVTQDEKHIPVLMKAKIIIGSITAELISQKIEDFDKLFVE